MKVACVILNYNDSETTQSLIHLIKDYEEINDIVVVDNNSTDGSYERLRHNQNEKIVVIKADRNGGYGYGNNFGIRYATEHFESTHILISNPDVEFTDETVKALKEAFLNHKECAIIAPTTYNKGKVVAWKLPSLAKDLGNSTFLFRKILNINTTYDMDYFKDKKTCYVDVISGSLLMVDAAKMKEHGMYDEEIFLYNEEKVLGIKMRKQGYKSILLLDQTFLHYHGVSVRKTFSSLIKLKKIVNDSELIYLEKYRNVKGFKLFLVKLYLKYAVAEMACVAGIKKLQLLKSRGGAKSSER